MSEIQSMQSPVCPVPIQNRGQIIMGHGSGGKLSHDLIDNLFMPHFDNPILRAGNDAGIIDASSHGKLVVSTDSHVVRPLFFDGGDIGRLAICGTVNDVAMMGAEPLYLTAGFILEEGLDLVILERVISSMCAAAAEAGIQIIAGDTKVVERGLADGMYINTAGIGRVPENINIGGSQAKPGDVVILSGPIGDHGIAVLEARGELGFETNIQSDVAPLNQLVQAILRSSQQVHVLRDPTRGGIASSMNEIARQSNVGIHLVEGAIPVRPAVAAACELLGFDPLYIANEGKLLAIVDANDADTVLTAMRSERYGQESIIIGEVNLEPTARVLMKTSIGSTRIVDMMAGEILPRIC
jgi:hydrogenase expression/formation protein HypE